MAMIFNESNKLFCTYCQHSYAGGPGGVYHPVYDNIAVWGPSEVICRDADFLRRVKNCPHAGHYYRFPEAEEL